MKGQEVLKLAGCSESLSKVKILPSHDILSVAEKQIPGNPTASKSTGIDVMVICLDCASMCLCVWGGACVRFQNSWCHEEVIKKVPKITQMVVDKVVQNQVQTVEVERPKVSSLPLYCPGCICTKWGRLVEHISRSAHRMEDLSQTNGHALPA